MKRRERGSDYSLDEIRDSNRVSGIKRDWVILGFDINGIRKG